MRKFGRARSIAELHFAAGVEGRACWSEAADDTRRRSLAL